MKNKIISIIFCTSFLILPFTSSAEESQSKTYFNAGMMSLSMDTLDDLKGIATVDDEASVLSLGVGYNVSPNLACPLLILVLSSRVRLFCAALSIACPSAMFSSSLVLVMAVRGAVGGVKLPV